MFKGIALKLQTLLTTLHSISQHNWDKLCIQLRNQQNLHFRHPKLNMGGLTLNLILLMLHCRFAIANASFIM